MIMNRQKIFVFFMVIFSMTITAAKSQWSLDIETGPVFASSNTIQVPNPGGTRFSLSDDFEIDNKLYFRIRLNYLLSKRHQLSVLFAPLTLNANGILNQEVVFQNTTFLPGDSVEALYRFNSYRLTYRYLLVNSEKLKLWIGFTAKIRDAKILLSSESSQDETTNVGFVPLLNLLLDWKLGEKIGLVVEADALASPAGQGRAEDLSISMYYQLAKKYRLRLGYRLIEGGADVEEVYNFAFLNYIFTGVQFWF